MLLSIKKKPKWNNKTQQIQTALDLPFETKHLLNLTQLCDCYGCGTSTLLTSCKKITPLWFSPHLVPGPFDVTVSTPNSSLPCLCARPPHVWPCLPQRGTHLSTHFSFPPQPHHFGSCKDQYFIFLDRTNWSLPSHHYSPRISWLLGHFDGHCSGHTWQDSRDTAQLMSCYTTSTKKAPALFLFIEFPQHPNTRSITRQHGEAPISPMPAKFQHTFPLLLQAEPLAQLPSVGADPADPCLKKLLWVN